METIISMNMNKKNKGFTLVEMLASIVIVILLTIVLTTFTGLAARVFSSVTRDAQGQTLASTLMHSILDELRYATEIDVDENNHFTYFSTSSGLGKDSMLTNSIEYVNDENRSIIVVENDVERYPIINGGSYVFDLNAYVDPIYVNGMFEVTLTIKDSNDEVICEKQFSVKPLNPSEVD